MIYFTSDWHLGHANIIKYCERPFEDVEMMNAMLIQNFNDIVKENDTTYFLGDFCFYKDVKSWIAQLHGYKIFLWGNHDKNELFRTFPREIRLTHHGQDIHLTHFPQQSQGADLQLVGHVHEKWKHKDNMINVGVDQWDFKPVSIKELIRYKKRLANGL